MERTCMTCRFWHNDNEPEETLMCLCCRHAPMAIAIEAEEGSCWDCEPQYGIALWPATDASAWCGEWEQIPKKGK